MRVLDDLLSTGVWREVVAEHGTPAVIVDAAIIRERAKALRRAFPNARLVYALKANYNPHIVRLVLDEGFGIDAVSPNEIRLARMLGVPPQDIVYVENAMSPDDLAAALAEGVRMVIGSLGGLERYAAAKPGGAVSLRVNGDIGASSHAYTYTAGPKSKFGIHVSQLAEARAIAAAAGVAITGLQQHIGSNWIDPEPFVRAAEALVEIARDFPDATSLDFGGGFGIPYRPEDHHLDIDAVGDAVRQLVRRHRTPSGGEYEIGFEPGRYVVAESSAILTRVNDRKVGGTGRIFVGTDTGFNQLIRPALYGAWHRIVNLSGEGRPVEPVDVCGNLCEESDYLARERMLPAPEVGDILAIMDAGAYGLAQASDYNLRLTPPEILIDGDERKLIRRRKTLAEMMAQFGM